MKEMLLGNRARPPIIKRTTSMTEFTLDPPLNYQDQSVLLTRRKSADFIGTAHFLRVCSFCEGQLIASHDIYMYRGDSAFCSLDCREKQMKQDKRKDKCTSAAARKKIPNSSAVTATTVASGAISIAPLLQIKP